MLSGAYWRVFAERSRTSVEKEKVMKKIKAWALVVGGFIERCPTDHYKGDWLHIFKQKPPANTTLGQVIEVEIRPIRPTKRKGR
jgi:hypothetical protein